MGLFHKKKSEDIKLEIPNAGGVIVTKSILNGESKLRWFDKDELEHTSGWMAIGDTDTQEYLDNLDNVIIVDYNTLIQIVPAAYEVYYMPNGSRLVLINEDNDEYFIDEQSGKRATGYSPKDVELLFRRNLDFLSETEHDELFYHSLFEESEQLKVHRLGDVEVRDQTLIVGDPIYLLDNQELCFQQRLNNGIYPMNLHLMYSNLTGWRVAANSILIRDEKPVRYQSLNGLGSLPFFGVDTGMMAAIDGSLLKDYKAWITTLKENHQSFNLYDDVLAEQFEKSIQENASIQSASGNFFELDIPQTNRSVLGNTTGLGDGAYSLFGGYDSSDELCIIIIPFLNVMLFKDR